MRTISELLEILRDNTNAVNNKIHDGLCLEVMVSYYKGWIQVDEKEILREYIKKNMPQYKLKNRYGMIIKGSYGWHPCEWSPRLKWLNEHIELNKEKEQ